MSSRRTPGPIIPVLIVAEDVNHIALTLDHAVWVPAFAGTTLIGPAFA
jgi:hypothetical protein